MDGQGWHHRRSVIGGMIAATAGATLAWCTPALGQATGYVAPEAFGAVGDGVTNDAAAFHAAC